ncbi:hypothetical protein [Paenibacillus sp. DMB20]|uniref:hypothetical protein n=1 Tax=Paenibacillus sp. DMB20 TaxID=1642570 RepID=UPI0006279F7A|nr:hypothetical protein [Paenibacillus sp. DMB20]KKO54279.1 hypothetical protein XI25_09600 [Paenibacillus sp. DMB20]
MRRVKKSRNAKLGPKRRVSKGRKLIGRRRVRARRVVSAVTPEQQALEYNEAYDKGFDEAYNEGFNVGYTEGMNTGHQEAN